MMVVEATMLVTIGDCSCWCLFCVGGVVFEAICVVLRVVAMVLACG